MEGGDELGPLQILAKPLHLGLVAPGEAETLLAGDLTLVLRLEQSLQHHGEQLPLEGEGPQVAAGSLHIGLAETSLRLRQLESAPLHGELNRLRGGGLLVDGLRLRFGLPCLRPASAGPDEQVDRDGRDCKRAYAHQQIG